MLRMSNGSHVKRVGAEAAQFAETSHLHLICILIQIKLLSPMWKISQKQPQDFWMLNTNRNAQKALHFFCQYHYNNSLFCDTQKIQEPQFSVQKFGDPQI